MKLPVKTILVFGWLWAGCVVAQARIGETPKECEERYGKPIDPADKSWQVYTKAGLRITAHFHEGQCDEMVFERADGREDISESERNALLKANAGGREWKKSRNEGGVVIMETNDGELEARYSTKEPGFMITTRDALKRRETSRAGDAEKKLKGF